MRRAPGRVNSEWRLIEQRLKCKSHGRDGWFDGLGREGSSDELDMNDNKSCHEDSREECGEWKGRKKSGEPGRAGLLSSECSWKRIYAAVLGIENVVM